MWPKAIALGADGCVIGTAEAWRLVAPIAETANAGRGCQVGITTTDPELTQLIAAEWGAQRIMNLYTSWCKQWRTILASLGLRSIKELRGRTDLLVYG